MPKTKSEGSGDLVQEVETGVLAQLQQPEGVQAALRFDGDKLKRIVAAVVPGLIQGVMVAGMDGQFTPAELVTLATETIGKILAVRNIVAAPTPDKPPGLPA